MLVGYLIKAWVNGNRVFTVPVTVSMVVNTLIAITLTSYLLSNAAALDKLFLTIKKLT